MFVRSNQDLDSMWRRRDEPASGDADREKRESDALKLLTLAGELYPLVLRKARKREENADSLQVN